MTHDVAPAPRFHDEKAASLEDLALIDPHLERKLLWKMDLHLVVSLSEKSVRLTASPFCGSCGHSQTSTVSLSRRDTSG